MKRILLTLLLLGIALNGVFGATAQPDSLKCAQVDSLLALGARKLSVNAPTKDQIRGFIKQNPILDNGVTPCKYCVQPRLKIPLNQGMLTDSFIARGINAINIVRYIAGLSTVTLDTSKTETCQKSVMMCATSKIDKPSAKIPDGMSKETYRQAKEIYAQSVLAVGSESLDRAVIFDIVKGANKTDMADVCGRRAILDPSFEQVSFGHIGKYALILPTTKADVIPVNQGIVAWPAQNTPLDYFDISNPLSLMFSDDYDVRGNVVLVMVRLNDGKMWKFGRLLPKQDGYYSTSSQQCGLPNCIVWRPNLDQYHADDKFSIYVSGIKFRGVDLPPIEYTISFFNLFKVFVNGCLNIMEPISSISSNDFTGNRDITSVDIAKSVKNIEKGAFATCINLERVKLPESIDVIANSVFKGCVSLKSIELPNTVECIEADAFAGCSALSSVGISYKLKTIERGSFMGCSSLISIDFPESLQEIGVNAFSDCSSLSRVEIPKNSQKIGTGAFSGCTSLKEVYFTTQVEGSLQLCAHAFQNCTSIDSISIPGSVQSIEEYTFDGCTNLKVIRIGEGVTKIADNSLTRTALERIYIPQSVQSIGKVTAIPTTATIYCKSGSYAEKWAKSLFRKYVIVP